MIKSDETNIKCDGMPMLRSFDLVRAGQVHSFLQTGLQE